MFRYALIAFVCLCFTCTSPTIQITETPELQPGVEELFTKVLKIPRGLTALQPDKIPHSEFPEQDIYHIRARIVIEKLSVPKLGSIPGFTLFATTETIAKAELFLAECVFHEVGVRFQIESVSFREYQPEWTEYALDSIRYPEYMSVYYMLPNDFPHAGISASPWHAYPWGILVATARDDYTLAHEIGHYFGLLHTFDEDFCDDTLPHDDDCEHDSSPVNCGNIMNYCWHNRNILTPEQACRARAYLRAARQSHVVSPMTALDRLTAMSKHLTDVRSLIMDTQPVATQPATTQPQ